MTMTITGLENEALVNAAFERVLPELLALNEAELAPISLDISSAVITVLGVLQEVKELRPQMAAQLPTFDLSQVDKLEDYALALSYAHARYLSATKEPNDLEALTTEATRLRERLLAEARALTHHGIVAESQLANLKGANGKKNIATDVLVLAGLLQGVWPQIQGKTPTRAQDLEQALRVATRLQRAMGLKEQGPAQVAEVADHRLRAYNKLLEVYESIQRAVAFLRGARYDADDIVPNLHPGRPGRSRADADTQVPPGTVAPGGSGTPGTASAAGTTSGTPGAASATSAAPAPGATPALSPSAFAPGGPFMPST